MEEAQEVGEGGCVEEHNGCADKDGYSSGSLDSDSIDSRQYLQKRGSGRL